MVIKLVPALFEAVLTVGCVVAAIQTPVVVLVAERKEVKLVYTTNTPCKIMNLTSTYRNSIKAVFLQVLFGSDDVLGQVQIV